MADPGCLFAVVLGSNHPCIGSVTSLRYAENDAEAVHNALSNQRYYQRINIKYLTKYSPCKLRDELNTISHLADKADGIIFYYAGHGLRELDNHGAEELWLTMPRGINDTISSSAFRLQEAFEILSNTTASSVTFMLDCCFSGDRDGRSLLGENLTKRLANNLMFGRKRIPIPMGRGRTVLAACCHDQCAHETTTLRHGVFTYALLKFLWSTQENGIRLSRLYSDIQKYVWEKTNGSQTPCLLGADEGTVLPTFCKR